MAIVATLTGGPGSAVLALFMIFFLLLLETGAKAEGPVGGGLGAHLSVEGAEGPQQATHLVAQRTAPHRWTR